ncbi:unnamed protein product [Amoebophrya sp. A120]|nr:unnamed protein product [Amoebophrya sp. A120]|eukprot:GSA120T00000356001.1
MNTQDHGHSILSAAVSGASQASILARMNDELKKLKQEQAGAHEHEDPAIIAAGSSTTSSPTACLPADASFLFSSPCALFLGANRRSKRSASPSPSPKTLFRRTISTENARERLGTDLDELLESIKAKLGDGEEVLSAPLDKVSEGDADEEQPRRLSEQEAGRGGTSSGDLHPPFFTMLQTQSQPKYNYMFYGAGGQGSASSQTSHSTRTQGGEKHSLHHQASPTSQAIRGYIANHQEAVRDLNGHPMGFFTADAKLTGSRATASTATARLDTSVPPGGSTTSAPIISSSSKGGASARPKEHEQPATRTSACALIPSQILPRVDLTGMVLPAVAVSTASAFQARSRTTEPRIKILQSSNHSYQTPRGHGPEDGNNYSYGPARTSSCSSSSQQVELEAGLLHQLQNKQGAALSSTTTIMPPASTLVLSEKPLSMAVQSAVMQKFLEIDQRTQVMMDSVTQQAAEKKAFLKGEHVRKKMQFFAELDRDVERQCLDLDTSLLQEKAKLLAEFEEAANNADFEYARNALQLPASSTTSRSRSGATSCVSGAASAAATPTPRRRGLLVAPSVSDYQGLQPPTGVIGYGSGASCFSGLSTPRQLPPLSARLHIAGQQHQPAFTMDASSAARSGFSSPRLLQQGLLKGAQGSVLAAPTFLPSSYAAGGREDDDEGDTAIEVHNSLRQLDSDLQATFQNTASSTGAQMNYRPQFVNAMSLQEQRINHTLPSQKAFPPAEADNGPQEYAFGVDVYRSRSPQHNTFPQAPRKVQPHDAPPGRTEVEPVTTTLVSIAAPSRGGSAASDEPPEIIELRGSLPAARARIEAARRQAQDTIQKAKRNLRRSLNLSSATDESASVSVQTEASPSPRNRKKHETQMGQSRRTNIRNKKPMSTSPTVLVLKSSHQGPPGSIISPGNSSSSPRTNANGHQKSPELNLTPRRVVKKRSVYQVEQHAGDEEKQVGESSLLTTESREARPAFADSYTDSPSSSSPQRQQETRRDYAGEQSCSDVYVRKEQEQSRCGEEQRHAHAAPAEVGPFHTATAVETSSLKLQQQPCFPGPALWTSRTRPPATCSPSKIQTLLPPSLAMPGPLVHPNPPAFSRFLNASVRQGDAYIQTSSSTTTTCFTPPQKGRATCSSVDILMVSHQEQNTAPPELELQRTGVQRPGAVGTTTTADGSSWTVQNISDELNLFGLLHQMNQDPNTRTRNGAKANTPMKMKTNETATAAPVDVMSSADHQGMLATRGTTPRSIPPPVAVSSSTTAFSAGAATKKQPGLVPKLRLGGLMQGQATDAKGPLHTARLLVNSADVDAPRTARGQGRDAGLLFTTR